MVSLFALWLPILLSAVVVFIASFIVHMVLPFHRNDYPKLPDEDKVMDALRPFNIPGGIYMAPRAEGPKEMRTPEFKAKFEKGPVFMLNIWQNRTLSMSKNLVQWFIYSIVIGIFAAYVAGRAVPAGAEYLHVFRFAGVTAFLGYTAASWQESIWYNRSWGLTFKNTIDGLLYALLTAGIFGWLWPA